MSLSAPAPSSAEHAGHDARRAQILGAARRCFAAAGFHGASMQEICAEARLSPGALYRYFPSKDAIIEAIAEDERASAMQILGMLRGPGPVVDRLLTALDHHLRSMSDAQSVQLMVEVMAEGLRNGAIRAKFVPIETAARDELRRCLVEGRARGEVGADVDIETVLDILLSWGDGLAFRIACEGEAAVAAAMPHVRRSLVALLDPPTAADGTADRNA